MMDVHLTALATYRPNRRLSITDVSRTWGDGSTDGSAGGPVEVVRVAGPDEDAVTLAVAAAVALPSEIVRACSTVILARTGPAAGSGDGAAVVAMALGLPRPTRTFEVAGSDRCFFAALEVAVALVRSDPDAAVLVVGGDDSRFPPGGTTERRHGHGGAAAVVSGAPGAAMWLGSTSASAPVPDRWFGTDGARRDAGERFFALSVVPALLADLPPIGSTGGSSTADVLVALPDRRAAERIAATLGSAGTLEVAAAWDHGVPAAVLPAVLLVEGIAAAASGITLDVLAFGSGASRIRVEVGDPGRARPVVEQPGPMLAYATFLRSAGAIEPPISAPAASPVSAWRDLDVTLGLLGAVCDACGATYFPLRPACAACGAHARSRPVRLVGEATVVTSTTDHLVAGVNPGTPESPTTMVVAETEAGARLFLPAVHGAIPAIGSRVRTVLRLAHQGGGFRNYHWRLAPALPPS